VSSTSSDTSGFGKTPACVIDAFTASASLRAADSSALASRASANACSNVIVPIGSADSTARAV
jgi:hypothetical protein